jgi:hypothetical protein
MHQPTTIETIAGIGEDGLSLDDIRLRIEARIERREADTGANIIANARDRREWRDRVGTQGYNRWMHERWGMSPKAATTQIEIAELADAHMIDDFLGEPGSLPKLARCGANHPVTAMVVRKMRGGDFMSVERIKTLKKAYDNERGGKPREKVADVEVDDRSWQIGIDAIASRVIKLMANPGSLDDLPSDVMDRLMAAMPSIEKLVAMAKVAG